MRTDRHDLLRLLEDVAHRLGVEIRCERLARDDEVASPRSGLCRLRDRRVVLMDSSLSADERCAVIARALRTMDLGGIFLPPAVRELLDGE